MKQGVVISINGPTAIGKTSLSIEVAKHFNTEIISCDSRQFYKEMTIGTAVPELYELKSVKHHFIQNLSIFEDYSVGDYEKDAIKLIRSKFTKLDTICLVGGSGLYQKAVLEGLDYFPEVDKSIREKLNERFNNEGIETLQIQLKTLDPDYYKKVDLSNPHRLIRALEICVGTNKPYSTFINQNKKKQRPFNCISIGLTAEREIIYSRIEKRVEQMFKNGLVEEVKRLYPHKALNALNTVGYKEIFRYFEGELSLDEAKSEIKKNTRRYAKRQLTWLKKQENIKWFSYSACPTEILKYIVDILPANKY